MNAIEIREKETIELMTVLREKGFVEGVYEKPNRIFTKGEHTIRVNVRDSKVLYTGTLLSSCQSFRGDHYKESIAFIKNLQYK